jgi:pSer/pThr/pTyr-binding forkhead associated (FHA) protein
MTAKIILSLDGALIQEYLLTQERMTIGRKAHNAIVINNLAVSGEHAAIITLGHDSFLEDLDSTNGLTVNGTVCKKHFLQNNDVVEIGKYKLRYLNDHVSQTTADDFEKTMILRVPVRVTQAAADQSGDTGLFQKSQAQANAPASDAPVPLAAQVQTTPGQVVAETVAVAAPPAVARAAIQILNGPSAGKELELVKGLTTLGKPGVQVAVLTRRPQGFFITHVEGASYPSVNGQVLDGHPHPLQDHDVIELAGIKMEFYFKN